MMRLNIKPRKQNSPRPAWKVADAFRQWLRGRPCACGGRNPDCSGQMQAAHVDYAGKGTADAKGAGTKAADRCCIPLSAACHALQHQKGWLWFDVHILGAINRGQMMAAEYWRLWPARAKWESDNGY